MSGAHQTIPGETDIGRIIGKFGEYVRVHIHLYISQMMNKEAIISYMNDKNASHKRGVVTSVCNPTTQELEAGGSEVQRHPWFHTKFKVSLDYIKTLCQKNGSK